MKILDHCKTLITSINADALVIDILLCPAVDACRMLNRRYIIASPVHTFENVKPIQPWMRGLYYYPL